MANPNLPKIKISNNRTRALFSSSCLILSISLLSSCSYLPDWFGEAKKNSGIKGTRISVLQLEAARLPDSALSELKVVIPAAQKNESWFQSDGHHELIPENPEVFYPFKSVIEKSTGNGASKGQHINATPIIADGKIFTISPDSKISAFDALNIKKEIWSIKLKLGDKSEKFSSAAGITYHNGKIYASSGYSQVVAIDATNGNIIWTRNINSIARSAPAATDNMVFVNTIDNRLYSLDATDGGILWTNSGSSENISMFGSAAPVTNNNIVIAPYSSGEIYALNIKDGSEVWSDTFARRSLGSASTLSDIDAPPVISKDKVFIISNDGVLASSDLKSGRRMWEQSISGRQSPWIAGDFLYVLTNKNEVLCIHASSGGIKWLKQLPSYKKEESKDDPIKWSGPVLASDVLWLVSSQGKLIALSPQDGLTKYEHKVPKDINIAPVVAHGNIYLYTDDAQLVQMKK